MDEITLVRDFAVIMVVAGAVTLIFRKLKQPVILGYLIAGVLIGPYTFPTPPVEDLHTIRLLADLGLILLLFGLGIEFSWSKIRQIGIVVAVIGALEILTMIGLGYSLGKLLGWSAKDSLFLGAALHISSSAIIVKMLRDMEWLSRDFAKLIVGILIVEDFAAVIIITVLSGTATTGTADIGDIGSLIFRLFIFIIATLTLGTLIVPKIIRFTHQFRSQEAILITSLALCFAMALTSRSLGLSVASGAFLMGALIGDTKYSEEVTEVITPIRDMFAAIFFVAIGMLVDIGQIGDFIVPAVAVSIVFILGKIISNSLATILAGYNLRRALHVGMSMPIIGEFSLAIAKLGLDKGVVTAPIYPVIALVTALTSFIGPYIARSAESVANFLDHKSPRLFRAYISRLEEWPQAFHGFTNADNEAAFRIRHSIRAIVVNLVIIVFIVGTGTFILHLIRDRDILGNVRIDILGTLVALTVLTMCVPSFILLWRNIQALIADAALYRLSKKRTSKGWRYQALRIVIRDSILLVVFMFIFLWFIPLISDLLSIGSYAMITAILLLAILLFSLSGFVRQIHTKLTQTFSQTIIGKDYGDIHQASVPHMYRGIINKVINCIGFSKDKRLPPKTE